MANQTYQVVLTGNLAGQFVQNVLHYRMDDSSFTNRLLSAKGLLDGWIADDKDLSWFDMLPEPYIYLSAKARCITGGGGPEHVNLTHTGQTGSRGSTIQTSSAGPVVIWHTDGPNRSTGKVFLPGIAVGDVQGGEISAACITALEAALADFITSFPAVGGTTPECYLCVAKSGDPDTRYLVDNYRIAKDVGQQRRRQLPV